jgi:hypothetical protein
VATITAVAGGGNWNATGTWDTATVPTAADEVVLGAASGAVTINVASTCRSLNASAYTSTLTHAAAVNLTIGDATAATGNAGLVLGSGVTYTLGNALTSALVFASTSATQQTVTTAGKVVGNITFSGAGGSWILADDLTSSGAFKVGASVMSTNNKTLTCLTVECNGSGVNVTFGTSTINLSGTTSGAYLFLRTNGATFTMGAATINITGATSNSRNFAAALTATSQATLNYTVANSSGGLVFVGATDLAVLNVSDGVVARTLTIPSGSSVTFRSFNVVGTPGALISLVSSVSGTRVTVSRPTRVTSADYLAIKDIGAAGGACWYAGANSVDNGNNTGWMFTPPTNWQFGHFAGVG